jgi:hypothetical protein
LKGTKEPVARTARFFNTTFQDQWYPEAIKLKQQLDRLIKDILWSEHVHLSADAKFLSLGSIKGDFKQGEVLIKPYRFELDLLQATQTFLQTEWIESPSLRRRLTQGFVYLLAENHEKKSMWAPYFAYAFIITGLFVANFLPTLGFALAGLSTISVFLISWKNRQFDLSFWHLRTIAADITEELYSGEALAFRFRKLEDQVHVPSVLYKLLKD